MLNLLSRLNSRMSRKFQKMLWLLVIVGMVSAIPLTIERIQTEQSAKQVEIVMDYKGLVRLSVFQANPERFMHETYERIKAAGVHTLAVYESTLVDLAQQRRIQLYNASEAALLRGTALLPDENFTYVLFTDARARAALQPIIETEFANREIPVRSWDFQGQPGLIIEASYHEASMLPMEPDPLTIAELKQFGFQVAVRLSNNRPLALDQWDDVFHRLNEQEVRRIIFSGDEVTGWTEGDAQQLQAIGEMMKQYRIGFAAIELLNKPQKGTSSLAYWNDYDTVRLHSILERESSQASTRLADRIVLAVTDRNIRMIYLNIDVQRDAAKAELKDTLHNILLSLNGEKGALERIKAAGYELGTAEPFQSHRIAGHKIFKLITVVGGIALVALMAGKFISILQIPIFLLGLIGGAGLYVLNSTLLLQALALASAIAAPVLGTIYAMRKVHDHKNLDPKDRKADATEAGSLNTNLWLKVSGWFIAASAISLIGAVFVFGLLNTITYSLVLEQFRGVNLLHLAPIALVGIYYLFYLKQIRSVPAIFEQIKMIFLSNLKLGYTVLAGFAGLAVLYYLSRTGNTGQASTIEMVLRTVLEDTLGIRPRTKEFLFAHPLFIFALYCAFKYRFGLVLLVPAVIGQLSMVDTFAHLHTPLWISAVRVVYGLGFGMLFGLVVVAVWEVIIVRSWRKWIVPLKES